MLTYNYNNELYPKKVAYKSPLSKAKLTLGPQFVFS